MTLTKCNSDWQLWDERKKKIFLIYDEAERLIYKLEREDRHHILRGIRYTYADFCPVSAEQLYGRQITVREMNQLLIGMDSNALRQFLNNLEGADSEKLCQERATEQEYYQGKEALAVCNGCSRKRTE